MSDFPKTARGIIVLNICEKEFIIFIRRRKYQGNKLIKLYYTFPGGHVEVGESYEETLQREIKEELGIEISIEREYLKLFNEDLQREEKFFICKYKSGNIGDAQGEEFSAYNEKYGFYDLIFIQKSDLDKYNILPSDVKNYILNDNNEL